MEHRHPGSPRTHPAAARRDRFDWEVELGVVIGKTARYVSKEQALDYVYGYTIINDASARDLQFVSSQWATGKIGDTLAPVGPYIADTTEIPDPHGLDLKTWVNGTLMQNGNTRNFIFDVRYLVSYLSQLMTLLPGDLIATGTPAGVGFSRKPPITLQPATPYAWRSLAWADSKILSKTPDCPVARRASYSYALLKIFVRRNTCKRSLSHRQENQTSCG